MGYCLSNKSMKSEQTGDTQGAAAAEKDLFTPMVPTVQDQHMYPLGPYLTKICRCVVVKKFICTYLVGPVCIGKHDEAQSTI